MFLIVFCIEIMYILNIQNHIVVVTKFFFHNNYKFFLPFNEIFYIIQ